METTLQGGEILIVFLRKQFLRIGYQLLLRNLSHTHMNTFFHIVLCFVLVTRTQYFRIILTLTKAWILRTRQCIWVVLVVFRSTELVEAMTGFFCMHFISLRVMCFVKQNAFCLKHVWLVSEKDYDKMMHFNKIVNKGRAH